MMGMQIDRAGPLTRAELVGIGEGIFEHFHHRYDAGGLIFDTLDRRPGFAKIREQKRHAAAAFR